MVRGRANRRGLTLIEISIAIAVAAMATAMSIISINALTHASLKSTAIELTGAIKFSYDRAIMEKRIQRIGMDIDKGVWWLEYTEDPYALSKTRSEGEEGHQRQERDAEEPSRSIFDHEDSSEVRHAMEGGKAIHFVPDEGSGAPKPLPSGIRFSKIWTGQREVPATSGTEYLHFFRMGWTEAAQIEITDGDPLHPSERDEYVTLKVFPLTGRVRTYQKRLEDPEVEEHDGQEEGDE